MTAAPRVSAPVPPSSSPLEGALDVSLLSRLGQDGFSATLDAIADAKTLLIDPALAGPLGRIADLAALRQHGVEKMFWLEEADESVPVSIHAPTRHLLYLCRPEIRWMRTVTSHLAADPSSAYTYTIAFVPSRTETCIHFLRTRDLLRRVSLVDFGLEFSVLDTDLLSLDDATAWPRMFLDGDHTPLFGAAQALMTLQRMYGLFPRVVGKGDLANRLCDLLVRQRREHTANSTTSTLQTPSSQVDALIVLDRTVDLVTPLSIQLTYEGLLDEVVGLSHGFIDVDAAWVGAAQSAGTGARRKIRLDGTDDTLFAALRDSNFASVPSQLHSVAKRISSDYDERHAANTVHQIRAFVNRLGSLQSEHASLRLHTCLTEQLLATTNTERFHRVLEIQQSIVAGASASAQLTAIEELLDLAASPLSVLRLACLASVVYGGVKRSWLETFRVEFVHTYGLPYLPLLLALEKMHILYAAVPPSSKVSRTTKFGQLLKPLRLVDDEVDERTPQDISYVFSGYAPLSIRLVQLICQHETPHKTQNASNASIPKAARIAGWRGVDDLVLQTPGASFDFLQLGNVQTLPDDIARTTIVFFLGGITYAEIAALRLMSRQQSTRRFLILTTSIVSGNSLLTDLNEVLCKS